MHYSRHLYKIEKLYADCIDDAGNCFIIYQATLHFMFIRLNYSSLIFSDNAGKVIEFSSFRKASVDISGQDIQLAHKRMAISGIWKRIDDGLVVSLFTDSHNKKLIWNCHHPKAGTEIRFNGGIFSGLGYAETLSLYFKPWNLPIDELKWGRYLSETDTIIWIKWKGSFPLNKLFYNNKEYNDAYIGDDEIAFADKAYHIIFSGISIIRKGNLSDVLARQPWLKLMFRKSILTSMETKYKAKSAFLKDEKIVSSGWSLYETVLWKH
jgi:hypothetical protein